MIFGPEQTLPIGSAREGLIKFSIDVIDYLISNTEGNTVTISKNRLWTSDDDIRETLINLYKTAGWKFAYFYQDIIFEYFILSNDPNHVKKSTPPKRSFFDQVKSFLGFH